LRVLRVWLRKIPTMPLPTGTGPRRGSTIIYFTIGNSYVRKLLRPATFIENIRHKDRSRSTIYILDYRGIPLPLHTRYFDQNFNLCPKFRENFRDNFREKRLKIFVVWKFLTVLLQHFSTNWGKSWEKFSRNLSCLRKTSLLKN